MSETGFLKDVLKTNSPLEEERQGEVLKNVTVKTKVDNGKSFYID